MHELDVVVDHTKTSECKAYTLRIIKNTSYPFRREIMGQLGFHVETIKPTLDTTEEQFIIIEAEELKIIGEHFIKTANYILENKS